MTDPFKTGSAEDLLVQDAAAKAAEAAEQAEQERRDKETEDLAQLAKQGNKSDGDLTGTDDTLISEEDLSFLNGK